MTEPPVILPIHTACKGCFFAEAAGKTQTGCSLGRLDLFRAAGVEVVEAYDESGEFFVVNGRVCAAKRSAEWAARHQDPAESARREIRLKAAAVVVVDEGDSVDDASARLGEMASWPHLPVEVVLVNNSKGVKTSSLHAAAASAVWPFDWRLTDVAGKPAPFWMALGEGVAQVRRSGYYLCVMASSHVRGGLLEAADRLVNDRLGRFCVLYGQDDWHGLLASVRFHNNPVVVGGEPLKNADGGKLSTLKEKALYLAGVAKAPWVATPWESVL